MLTQIVSIRPSAPAFSTRCVSTASTTSTAPATTSMAAVAIARVQTGHHSLLECMSVATPTIWSKRHVWMLKAGVSWRLLVVVRVVHLRGHLKVVHLLKHQLLAVVSRREEKED